MREKIQSDQTAAKLGTVKGRPDYFAAYYLKDELPLRIPPFHLDIYKHLADWSLKRLVFIAPTGFGKSSVAIFAYPVYLACFNLCRNIILLSNTATFATRKLRDVKSVFEHNEKIQSDFKIEPGRTWRDDEIEISNGVRILALGAGSQITGERPDVIIGDDIQTEKEAKSEIERASLDYWWYASVLNRPAPDGRIILIGSISSPLAFLNKFRDEKEKKTWTVREYATKDCHTIWPEKWSDTDLQKKKVELAGLPGIYEALYESDVSQIQKYAFRKSWLRYYDKVPEGLSVFTVVDPAIGERLTSDYTCILTGGIDLQGNIFILDVVKKRFNVESLQMFGALFTVYEVYKPIKIGFETIGFQKYIQLLFKQECNKRGSHPSTVEIQHDTKVTKAMRITSLAPIAQGGQLFIRADMYDFISEWEAYPEVAHDDVLDAASMLKDLAMQKGWGSNTGVMPQPTVGIGNTNQGAKYWEVKSPWE